MNPKRRSSHPHLEISRAMPHSLRRFVLPTLAAGALMVFASAADAQRPRREPKPGGLPPMHDVRSIDGTGNNETHPEWGAAETPFKRLTQAAYEDGIGAPSGSDRPSARAVSNALCAQPQSLPNSTGYSDFLWQWGQFLDHDITETPVLAPPESFNIPVPSGDPFFDPFGTGIEEIALNRSFFELIGGVREQFNAITAYIDASNVYGSDEDRARELRTLDGTGKLKTSAGGLLPYNVNGFANAPTSFDPTFFLAGDVRANEQIGLTAMHTLFVREHNSWAERIAKLDRMQRTTPMRRGPGMDGIAPGDPRGEPMTDDEIYEMARAIVSAEMQVITFREFLPVLLGPGAIPPYTGYNPNLDPSISNVFAAAAFRLGHTMLSPTMMRVDAAGQEIPEGHIALADAFFTPAEIEATGIEPVLRGLAAQRAQEFDAKLIGDVRNFLFGPPGAGGFDLAALNMQRGRDHGLPSYNQVRADFGLTPVASFAGISSDPAVEAKLASVYTSPDQVDPWVGMLCEDRVPGALVGETLFTILTEQFTALRDGDRYWYQRQLPRELRDMVEKTRLSHIIRRNTTIGHEIPDDVFKVRPEGGTPPPPPPGPGDPTATPTAPPPPPGPGGPRPGERGVIRVKTDR
ncbi:MAG: peroxidase family protein [Sumerlaeia bacterium]